VGIAIALAFAANSPPKERFTFTHWLTSLPLGALNIEQTKFLKLGRHGAANQLKLLRFGATRIPIREPLKHTTL
jgi:hypothetical protein